MARIVIVVGLVVVLGSCGSDGADAACDVDRDCDDGSICIPLSNAQEDCGGALCAPECSQRNPCPPCYDCERLDDGRMGCVGYDWEEEMCGASYAEGDDGCAER